MRYILISLALLFSWPIYSQKINSLKTKQVYVSYDKTTHLIFPTDIKYSSSIEEIVIIKNPLPNILSMKANDKDFSRTTLNVATADGKFYAYDVFYKEDNDKTSYYVTNDSIGKEIEAGVNLYNQLHLVFPNSVKYIDYGADWIEAKPIDNIQNIVKVETFEENQKPTNISVVDETNRFYTFDIKYNPKETNFNILVGQPEQVALLAKEDLTDNSKETILVDIKKHGRNIYNLGVKKSSILFAIQNIFIKDNKLIFRFNFKNTSNVKYDIDYMKFYVVDKKQTKESALQELEYKPIFLDNYKTTIEGKTENTYSVCFEKFTIPDKKNFIIEINERMGGRHIYFKIDNRPIENAQEL